MQGSHSWQYLLDTKTNTLRNITTSPPTWNAHGCVFYKGAYHVVTDGGPNNTGLLTKIDPITLTSTPLLNNYYQQPFIALNDIDIDEDGNYWITDDRYGKVNVFIAKQASHRFTARAQSLTTKFAGARDHPLLPSIQPRRLLCRW